MLYIFFVDCLVNIAGRSWRLRHLDTGRMFYYMETCSITWWWVGTSGFFDWKHVTANTVLKRYAAVTVTALDYHYNWDNKKNYHNNSNSNSEVSVYHLYAVTCPTNNHWLLCRSRPLSYPQNSVSTTPWNPGNLEFYWCSWKIFIISKVIFVQQVHFITR